ncbi:hypothetical protein [Aerosakkonema funiforme]|uniref:Uncharacterized protein n=1 Tax=Aerosakkonema funiforme FACHB-1375 TaxID=2949571 RepID=A0A926VD85_9CYAN|nr:hypothetical protein [Aerosakkonema funiforme]MBD2181661.1 hypothetical protein [Aerosakkonema funiforme FACHB-1375]
MMINKCSLVATDKQKIEFSAAYLGLNIKISVSIHQYWKLLMNLGILS